MKLIIKQIAFSILMIFCCATLGALTSAYSCWVKPVHECDPPIEYFYVILKLFPFLALISATIASVILVFLSPLIITAKKK